MVEHTFFNSGASILNRQTVDLVERRLSALNFSRAEPSAPKLRTHVLDVFRELGWSDQIQLDPSSQITINGVYSGIGLAVQMGNICRFYADLLKLQTLFTRKRILGAFYVVAFKRLAVSMGQNLANYERVTQELDLFCETITFPVAVFGLECN